MHPLCSICFEMYTTTDKLNTTQCGHIFHWKCLQTWTQNSKTCPECRKACQVENLIPIFIHAATVEDLDESQAEVSELFCKIYALTKEMTGKDKIIANHKDEIDELKTIVSDLEDSLKHKNDEIASLKNELESLQPVAAKCLSDQGAARCCFDVVISDLDPVQKLKSSKPKNKHRNLSPRPHQLQIEESLKATSLLILRNGCDFDQQKRIVVVVEPLSTNVQFQNEACRSQPAIEIVTVNQQQQEVVNDLEDLINTLVQKSATNSMPDNILQSDFDRCFGVQAFSFEGEDIMHLNPDNLEISELQLEDNEFDFSIFDVNPHEDPEMALALKTSLEEASKYSKEDEEIALAIKLSLQTDCESSELDNGKVISFLKSLIDGIDKQ